MLLNKINLTVTAMAVLMFSLIPVVYAHNQDWNDGFKSGAVDGKVIGRGTGDDDDTCPNNGYNDSQCDQFNDGYDAGFNSTCVAAHKNSTWGCPAECTQPIDTASRRLPV